MSKRHESDAFKAKKAQAKEISKKLEKAQSLILAEYRGLTVAEMTELREKAKEAGVELKVYKNRIFKFASSKDYADLDQHLVGPNIFAFSINDSISAAKVLADFAKNHKALVLKAGIFEGKVIDSKGVQEVATLPTYEDALAILGRSLLAPLQQLSLSLKLFSEKEEN